MSFYKYCECGNRFEAQRNNARFCSNNCYMRYYRELQVIKLEQQKFNEEQNALLEKERIRLEHNEALMNQLFEQQQAWQEKIAKEKKENELEQRLDYEKRQEQTREKRAEQLKKEKESAELKINLIHLGGIALANGLTYFSETMNNQPLKPESASETYEFEPQ